MQGFTVLQAQASSILLSIDGKTHTQLDLPSVGGGDWEECYEQVLYETRTQLSWSPGTQRSLVMIGDAIPHNTSYHLNNLKLDWKKEASKLKSELGVKIYSVQVHHD